METVISNLDFNGCLIQLTQSDGFDTMINATEIAKPFGKRPNDWFLLPSTKSYLKEFESDTRFLGITPVLTIKGNYSDGTRQGTWMHRWVALEFARWLSPKFSILDKKSGKPRNLRRWTESGKHWIWSLKKQLNLLS